VDGECKYQAMASGARANVRVVVSVFSPEWGPVHGGLEARSLVPDPNATNSSWNYLVTPVP
jgi:hypothetical protein